MKKRKTVALVTVGRVYKTMWPELVFQRIGNDWRFVATDGYAVVGEIYPTKELLLADMRRYAKETWNLE